MLAKMNAAKKRKDRNVVDNKDMREEETRKEKKRKS